MKRSIKNFSNPEEQLEGVLSDQHKSAKNRQMKKLNVYIIAILSLSLFTACEKVVDVDLPQGDPIPYLDAWINDKPGPQEIKFLLAANYLDNAGPKAIENAQITVTDLTNSKTYTFPWSGGAYRHDPGVGQHIGVIGHKYKLSVQYNGELYEATDILNRVPPVDSITYKFKEKSGEEEEGYYATFFAKDIPGAMDFYWIRTYRNGVINHNVNEQVSIDGSYYENVSDGLNFIVPIREGITDEDKPYKKGETVKVLIRGVSRPSYDFVRLMSEQMSNGGMFAKVLANVPTNVSNKAGSANKIYGWFGTVSESELSKNIE